MRTCRFPLLVAGLALAACDDSSGPLTSPPTGPPKSPPTAATLVVSTASVGNDPDQDGYLLTVDGTGSFPLEASDTSEIDLPAGQHTLRLLGMAEHCSVSPGNPLDLAVDSGDTTTVAFQVTCSVTGVRITVTTTGLDFDPDGYRLVVDGIARGTLPEWAPSPTGTVLTQLDPGGHTLALTGLSPNCRIEGPASRTISIVDSEIVPIDFAVVCTATSGVVGVLVEASGTSVSSEYEALVDGARPFTVFLSGPTYLTAVPAGDHVVSLVAPVNCSVETDAQSVTVTIGAPIRDTVEVTFSVICRQGYGTVRITAPTTGQLPNESYQVSWCESWSYPIMCLDLGRVSPNDTLVARVRALDREMFLHLRDVPERCGAGRPIGFTIAVGDTLDIAFPVTCRP